MTVTVDVVDTHCYTLGESPVWCEQNQRLYFLDILAKLLLIYHPESGQTERQKLPSLTSAITLTTDSTKLILVTVDGIYLYDVAKQTIDAKLADYPDVPDATRPNEAAVSPLGELFFGTMHYLDPDAVGHWYHLGHGQQHATRCGLPVSISNTLCWSGDTLYFADSKAGTIYLSRDGMKTQQRFAQAERGAPDGSTLCRDKKLWNARWGAAELAVYHLEKPDLSPKYIPLPAINPTSCCFGGRDLTTLFITTAALDLTVNDPWQGRLLAIPNAGKGNLTHRFKLPHDKNIKE